MTNITEIAPDVFRISTYVPEADLNFSQFLVRDDEPLLFHTGMKAMFPIVREAVSKIIDPAALRWIGFSHFEADECGSLNEWLAAAPDAAPVCSFLGKIVSVDDFAARPARGMADGEILETGRSSFRFFATPHVPHCWEAGVMYDSASGVLFCSDLMHQNGDTPAVADGDVVGRSRESIREMQQGPLANYMPYTPNTDAELRRLAALRPKVLATMHGSVFAGDGEKAMLEYAGMLREELGRGGQLQ